ncbi:DUF5134 domain-containing protein [Amycolatopsis aidingensis]|uniref:DUF5134 domain-containing protein n=1 Tax=Amycolatopsis aidingensis TaxID=2842453 RepID=UPI001C0C3340|nr:DUF5134 domain-containing protein [Amycolatopsis aidingensis]
MEHTALLPGWLRVVWVVASCAVALVHLRHVWVMTGQRRLWHIGHVLMASGMAYMYLPHPVHWIPHEAGAAAFTAAATGSLVAAMSFRLRESVLNPLWILITVEMAVMVYMFLPMTARTPLLSYILVVYLVMTGIGWILGRWDRNYRPASAQEAPRPIRPAPPALRVSLVTMIGAMAYMLLAM